MRCLISFSYTTTVVVVAALALLLACAPAPAPAAYVEKAAARGAAWPRARAATVGRSQTRGRSRRKPTLSLYAQRGLQAYEAMQRSFYVQGTGLYRGEPEYSFLWPFSQALAATVSLAHIPEQAPRLATGLRELMSGLRLYLGPAPSPAGYPAAPPVAQPGEEPLPGEGTEASAAASALRSYNGNVAPPIGPGGDSYYDDNEWVGIELARLYELDHDASALQQAQQIMEFVMAGWQTTGPEGKPLPCPGGVPFSNSPHNTDRNTVTDGPGAELAVQLYRITHESRYLQFAEMAYAWVRQCLLEPSGLYADHISLDGTVQRTLWSYNQGSMMGAGALLYQVTHDGAYLYQARQTAKAALAYFPYTRLSLENPFFAAVYFRNLLYLDSITHDPPGSLVREYAFYAWQRHRLSGNLFVYGSPPTAQLLGQASLVQVFALLSTPPSTFF